MAEMDGIETAKRIKSNRKTKHIPIVFVTGFDTTQMIKNKVFQAGAMDFITKPYEKENLKSKINNYREAYKHRLELQSVKNRLLTQSTYLNRSNEQLLSKQEEAKNPKVLAIGLYIVKTMVERLSGEIHCESNLGEGATFYFTIRDHI